MKGWRRDQRQGKPWKGPKAARDDASLRRCPYCQRVMSVREAREQGACNDCYER